jgi:hypothetical protein
VDGDAILNRVNGIDTQKSELAEGVEAFVKEIESLDE